MSPSFAPVLLLWAAAPAASHLALEKVSETVYVVHPGPSETEAVSNAAFVVLPDRVLVFDTLSSRDLMDEMMGMIQGVTALPVGMVALSHWHTDHSGGLDYFVSRPHNVYSAPSTSEDMRQHRDRQLAFLRKQEKEVASRARAATDSSESEPLDLQLLAIRREQLRLGRAPTHRTDHPVGGLTELTPGGRTVRLQHLGAGHTRGDLVVYLPAEKILLAGDVVPVTTLPNLADADTTAWLQRLDEIEAIGAEKIVPGHGPVGGRADLAAMRKYLLMLRTLVKPIAATGTPKDLVEQLRTPPPYDAWSAQDLWFPGALRVFHELRAAAPASGS